MECVAKEVRLRLHDERIETWRGRGAGRDATAGVRREPGTARALRGLTPRHRLAGAQAPGVAPLAAARRPAAGSRCSRRRVTTRTSSGSTRRPRTAAERAPGTGSTRFRQRATNHNAVFHYFIRRLLVMIPTLLVISAMVFFIIQLPEGDYLTTYIAEPESQGERVSQDKIALLRQQYGLDRHPASPIRQSVAW